MKVQYIGKLTELKFQQFSDQITSIILDHYLNITDSAWTLMKLSLEEDIIEITTTDTHSYRIISNSNNPREPIPTTKEDYGPKSRKPISATKISAKHGIPILHTSKSTASICTTSPVYSTTASELLSTTTNDTNNSSLSNSPLYRPSRPIPRGPAQFQPAPTGHPNQAFYLDLTEDQSFDKSTSVERRDVEQISQPFKQTKSNIPPANITENTTLAAIFSFDINNLNTYSLFSGAAINQNKPIMALYTNARVREINIKLILNSKLANSIIMKQLMNQLVDGNTKTLIGVIDNFPFEINGIQISIKILIMKHARVLAMCGHFKTQRTKEPLIEFKDTSLPPTIKTYQVLWADDYQTELPPPPTWEEKEKSRAEEEFQLLSLGYVTLDQRNLFYQPPKLICVNYEKKLSTMGVYIGDNKEWPTDNMPCFTYGKILPDEELWNDVLGREETYDEACQYTILINDWVQKGTPIEDAWKQALNRLDKQEQKLADLNTKLCDHCLIPCHFQYCNECNFMFNLPPKILFPITKLPKPEEEKVLITKNMLFQDSTEDTETEQYLTYSDLSKELELK
ncbi:hypothetical protein G9A89_011910 [Geosiphon pyriformis]|nr:hypothetical protein G9A89_011910 [Geosiphon pyriformis]